MNNLEFWSLHTIGKNKKLKSGYKQTKPLPYDFNITSTLSFQNVQFGNFELLKEHEYKYNKAVKAE